MKLEFKHGRDYFSPSQLKKLNISLASLNAYLTKVWDSSSAMDLGTAVHCKLLEPDMYSKRFRVFNNSAICERLGGARPTSTNAYKEWLERYNRIFKDVTIISPEHQAIVDRIYHNAAMTGIIDTYFTGGKAENTIQGTVTDFDTDFEALAIVDYDTDFQSIDLKTTSKPLHKFKWDADELGYDIQARLTNAINGKEFIFVVVQTVEPFDIGIFDCSDYFMNRGKGKINNALKNYEGYEDEFSTQVLNFTL